MDVSVIIPAYNERDRIGFTLDALVDYFGSSGWSFEVVVVDDGSEDGTADAVRDWTGGRGSEAVRVIGISHRGKGSAVAAGVMEARGRLILMSDADLSTPIEEWPKLAVRLEDGARVAIGSRQAGGARIEVHQPWARQQLGLLFGRLVGYLFPLGVIDSQCGFKAFEAEAARELFREARVVGYCFDVEVLLRARARGFRVDEVPVIWRNHPDSKVSVWKDWPRVLWELWQIRREMNSGMAGASDEEGRG